MYEVYNLLSSHDLQQYSFVNSMSKCLILLDIIINMSSTLSPLSSKDVEGSTPLYVAADCGETSAALYLISKGADVEVLFRFGLSFFKCMLEV